MLILEYATEGDLHDYLKRNDENLTWKSRLEILLEIIEGLHKIHLKGSFHRKLHSGNILKNQTTTFISDLGMCCPAEIPTADYNSSGVYGVLPYVAPELLRPFARELRDIIKRWYLGERNSLEFEEAEKFVKLKIILKNPFIP